MIGTALEEGCCRFFRVSMKIKTESSETSLKKSITVTSSLRSVKLLKLLQAMARPNSVTST